MKKIVQILSITLLIGCSASSDQEYVHFETSQPQNVKESKSFSKKTMGEYINCSKENDKLIVSNDKIVNYQTMYFITHRKDLVFDSGIVIDRYDNKEMKILFNKHGSEIAFMDDTIKFSHTNIDTIFRTSQNQILKKYKRSYFLNFKRGENDWEVTRLNLYKDTIFIGKIYPSDTLLQYDFATKKVELNSDSTKIIEYSMNPSKKEFKTLMKPNSFQETGCYCKKK